MPCFNRSNKGHIKRKSLSKGGFGISLRSTLVQKTWQNENPQYLLGLIPLRSWLYLKRPMHNIIIFCTNHNFLKNFFFSPTIIEWNNLDPGLWEFESFLFFFKLLAAWKMSKYGVFSGLYFPIFGLNTEIYSVNLRTPWISVFSPIIEKYGP